MRLMLATVLAITLATPAIAADGAALYAARCKACHSLTDANAPTGPSLKGVVGRKVASAPGYAYSRGLRARGGTWTDAALDAYLANPVAFAPGTRKFNRVTDPEARAALIAFLKSRK